MKSFLDSLTVELDKARDVLAVKAVTRPLTYSVQDVGLQLQVFPQYDGDQVKFLTAQPGEEGASELKIQLGSITARSIQETTSDPIQRDDVPLADLEGIDEDTKKSLEKVGVKSARDIERMEERNVDLQKVTDSKLDYGGLANVINKARRRTLPPAVRNVAVEQSAGDGLLSVTGENLAIAGSLADFPVARLDGRRVEVVSSSPESVELRVDPAELEGRACKLEIALDPFAVVSMDVRGVRD
ncbi:MAG TPA: hypothetical protein VJT68_03710 [Thermoleophilaceae bacterium]|nr:hypothetical protein [Thermoleophilaceae bacterium]